MSNTIIQVENVSKKYVIKHQHQEKYTTLRDALVSSTKSFAQKFYNQKSNVQNSQKEDFWALKDISFEIKQGDRVGIIGRNGAGKSTLLKILSRITEPTSGRISIKGRVASLLEVGTGFHAELTGRENIYLNGAVLGMSKAEIKRKFDEIVDFAEVEKFLDTPVKHYSSGMYVRLAFAVAAHLEPEILIVDEVLAVGDTDFQKKCLGKMQHVSEDQGRTVIFVSHNSEAIQRLCYDCILLEGGRLVEYGSTQQIMAHYLSSASQEASPRQWISLADVNRTGTQAASFKAFHYSSLDPAIGFHAYSDGPLEFLLSLESDLKKVIARLAVIIYDQCGNKLVNADTITLGKRIYLQSGQNTFRLRIHRLHLNPGIYILGFWIADPLAGTVFDFIESGIEFEVGQSSSKVLETRPDCDGLVTCNFELLSTESFEVFPMKT